MTAAVPRPLRADAQRNRERLVVAAREAFTRDGVGAPLDDIARKAGVGPGTLYRHFPSREALLGAVYRGDVETIARRADELAAELGPLEALEAWLGEQVTYAVQIGGFGGAVKEMLSTDTETLEWCRNAMRGAGGRLLARAQREGLVRPDLDVATLLRLVHAVGTAGEALPERADLMLSIVLSGLRTP